MSQSNKEGSDSGHRRVANAVVHVDPLGSTGMYICIYIHIVMHV
jgi:hypothetical protein